MLTKLLKYEFRSIGRQLIPLYLGVLGLAVVNHFVWFTSADFDIILPDGFGGIPAYATMMAYFAVCVALFVITILLIIQRFYKGLLTEEGYLMFTLPCKPWQLIAAKGIAASVMTIGGGCVGFASILLMGMSLRDWGSFFHSFAKVPWGELFDVHAFWPLYIVEMLILLLVSLFSSIGHTYVSIAIGHMFHRRRIACAIAAYIGINIIGGVLFATVINITNQMQLDRIFPNLDFTPWTLHLILLISILFTAIPAAIYFIGTNWILSCKLNLE